MQHADIPPPQSATLGLHPVARKLLLISHPAKGRMLTLNQWRSQALKSGWAHGVWGRKSPSGVQRRSPGVGLGAKPSEADRQFAAVKCFSTHVCFRVRPPSPLPPPPKNSSDLRESHHPTRPGQGGHVPTGHVRGHVPTCAHPWLH